VTHEPLDRCTCPRNQVPVPPTWERDPACPVHRMAGDRGQAPSTAPRRKGDRTTTITGTLPVVFDQDAERR
jgi:hypothetical protein